MRHRRLTITVGLLVLEILSIGLLSLEIASFASYLPRGNPAQRLHQQFRAELGVGEGSVILLEPEALYDADFHSELRELRFALNAGLPCLDGLKGLVNARYLIGGSGTLTSRGPHHEPVRDPSDLARLRERLRSNPLCENFIVSSDRSATALIVELDGSIAGRMFLERERFGSKNSRRTKAQGPP